MTQWRKVILLSIINIFFFFLQVPMQAGSFLETCLFAGGIIQTFLHAQGLFHWVTSDALLERFAFLSLFLFYCAFKSVLAGFLTDLMSCFHGCPALMLWKLLCTNTCPFSSRVISLSFIYLHLTLCAANRRVQRSNLLNGIDKSTCHKLQRKKANVFRYIV